MGFVWRKFACVFLPLCACATRTEFSSGIHFIYIVSSVTWRCWLNDLKTIRNELYDVASAPYDSFRLLMCPILSEDVDTHRIGPDDGARYLLNPAGLQLSIVGPVSCTARTIVHATCASGWAVEDGRNWISTRSNRDRRSCCAVRIAVVSFLEHLTITDDRWWISDFASSLFIAYATLWFVCDKPDEKWRTLLLLQRGLLFSHFSRCFSFLCVVPIRSHRTSVRFATTSIPPARFVHC